jgi:hypothetical protein
MDWRQQRTSWGSGGFGGLGGASQAPRDLWILLGVIFLTFSLRFFDSTRLVPELLSLTPAVYLLGFLWQLATYPFVGIGSPGIWFLVELLILFWFGRSVYSALGQKKFWRLLVGVGFAAGLVAMLVNMAETFLGGSSLVPGQAFVLMQGQRTLMVIIIAAFAVLYRNATILLFFVLPIQAKWFLWLELLFAFMGFLGTRDLAGFLGLCTAVGATYFFLVPGSARQLLRTWQLKLAHRRHEGELRRLRDKRGFRVVKDDDEPTKGPWVH